MHVQARVESLLWAKLLGNSVPQVNATWINNEAAVVRSKTGIRPVLAPTVKPVQKPSPTARQRFDDFIDGVE